MVTLVDGKKYVVSESLDEVIGSIRRHRGAVLAMGSTADLDPWGRHEPQPPRLGTVSELPTASRSGWSAEDSVRTES